MVKIAKRTDMGALLLMVLPLLLWASGWQWQPENNHRWLKGWYWLTQTVTSPWSILTSALLISWFLWCLRYRLKPALRLAAILTATLLIGQGMKSVIKERVQEPRPYVVWLVKHYAIDDRAFYAMPRKARSVAVARELKEQQVIPPWLQKHWRAETGFSFPSGHTISAASWALLAVGLLWPRSAQGLHRGADALGQRRDGQPHGARHALAAKCGHGRCRQLVGDNPWVLAGAALDRCADADAGRSAGYPLARLRGPSSLRLTGKEKSTASGWVFPVAAL